MKKKILALAAAVVVAFSATGCSELNNIFGNTSGDSSSTSTDSSSGTDQSASKNSSSDPDEITTKPQTVRCGDIIEENGVKVFDTEIICGNAFAVGYHYIRSENGRIENAVLSIKPMKTEDLKTILNDPIVGGSELSISDFELINGVYRMNEEKAKTMLGSLATTYSFDQYWKNQKMADLVSNEGISAEEARPKVDELFENMGKTQI
ncbi:MAG: hypothetical protein K2N56_06965 [Oscillospiraceae bacterium]|nr:hypothetical protein [Oscillospiraceae bacterium]